MLLTTRESNIDYADAWRAVRSRAAKRQPSTLKWIVILGIAFLVVILLQYSARSSNTPWLALGGLVAIAAITLLGLIAAQLLVTFSIRRAARDRDDDLITIEVTEGALICDNKADHTTYRWGHFNHFVETDKSFALLGLAINASPGLLLVIPKSCVPPQQLQELRTTILTHILPEAVAK